MPQRRLRHLREHEDLFPAGQLEGPDEEDHEGHPGDGPVHEVFAGPREEAARREEALDRRERREAPRRTANDPSVDLAFGTFRSADAIDIWRSAGS